MRTNQSATPLAMISSRLKKPLQPPSASSNVRLLPAAHGDGVEQCTRGGIWQHEKY